MKYQYLLIEGEYRTKPHLFNMGMCACADCGRLNPIDNKTCIECNEQLFIIVDDRLRQLETNKTHTHG